MHFYWCNDAVPWLNEAKSRIFRCTVIVKNFQIHLYFVCHLPAIRPGSATSTGQIFLTNNVIGIYNTNLLFRKRFIHCALMIPFILQWPSLFFSKVSNSRKVLITPGLYFPNYWVTYLPRDISRDFNKYEHVNLRWEWTRTVFKELYYTANNQKIADKKKADYQEGVEKSRADSAAWSRDSYMKDPEKSCAQSRESYMNNQEESCWQCSTKPWKLQERLGEESRW